MERKAKILVIEDEPAIRDGLLDVLVYHGYDADSADRGDEGLRKAQTGRYDLVLLDVMLPGIDGFEVCNRIRDADREQPIIMLTAKTGDEDIVQGLRLGADDYVGKPFSIQQLMLRVEAVLRRSRRLADPIESIHLDGCEIDTRNLRGRSASTAVDFTRREVEILGYLAANSDRPVSRDELLENVWGYARSAALETRTVDIHVAKLRRKIEPDPSTPRNLVTVRGAGYRLNLKG